MKNWAGNLTYRAARLHEPSSVGELQEIVASAAAPVRALGARHSFNRIGDTDGDLVSVAALPHRVEVSAADGRAVVAAGLRYGDVATALEAAGVALPNLPSLPHISVAGAVATGTHGSGDANRSLASSVAAVDLVAADGSLVTLRRGDPAFPGAVVSLGALGIAVALTLDVVPTFAVRQYVFDDLPLEALLGNLDEVLGSAYSVSAFTTWRPDAGFTVWRKQLASAAPPPDGWLGARPADGPRHPLPGMPGETTTEQLGVPGPWHERLPHFRLGFTPSNGDELQSELFVARTEAVAAIEALAALADRVAPVLQIAEVRSVAADDQWLSLAQGRDSVGFHFTWVPDEAAVLPVVALVEKALEPYAPRPHWAKLSALPPAEILARYPYAGDFAGLRDRLDPAGRFANAYVRDLFPVG